MTAVSDNVVRSKGAEARGQSGFTLIELMIVVIVLAVLASIAYASYENATIASRRKAGAACLLESAQFMERFYTTHLQYHQTRASPPVAVPEPSSCSQDVTAFYDFSFDSASPPTATALATHRHPDARRRTRSPTIVPPLPPSLPPSRRRSPRRCGASPVAFAGGHAPLPRIGRYASRAPRNVPGPGGRGGWRMADGGWPMADGRWPMADGGWRMAER